MKTSARSVLTTDLQHSFLLDGHITYVVSKSIVMSSLEIIKYNRPLSHVWTLIEKKHEHLLAAVQRYFVVRHFCLHMLKEMRLSKLKLLSQTDFRAVLLEDHSKGQTCVNSTLKVGKIYSFIKTFF